MGVAGCRSRWVRRGLLTAPVSPAAARPRRRIRPVRAAAALVALALLPAGVAVASGLSTADTGKPRAPRLRCRRHPRRRHPWPAHLQPLCRRNRRNRRLRRGRRRSVGHGRRHLRRSLGRGPRRPASHSARTRCRGAVGPRSRPPQPSEPWRTRRRRPGRRRQLLFGEDDREGRPQGAGTEAGGDEGRDVAMSTGVVPAETVSPACHLLEGRTRRRGVHRSTALDPPPCLRLRTGGCSRARQSAALTGEDIILSTSADGAALGCGLRPRPRVRELLRDSRDESSCFGMPTSPWKSCERAGSSRIAVRDA